MQGAGEVRALAVDEVPWSDVEQVFGTRGDASRCWCQWFKMPASGWDAATSDTCRNDFRRQVDTLRPSPGVIAYLGDEPVGWCAVEPRTGYPRLLQSTVVKSSPEREDDSTVWAVTCFVVRVGFRKRGIGGELLARAVEHARDNGARLVEGYPVDTAARTAASSAELYHGTLSLFEKAGFTITSRPTKTRAVVTLAL
ncbi:GNAT family N-acetyltransferase [Compostimonas suwonensis]|uniref:Acetyltransferase (GNAT) family protein n=1 Tax=Compostimonas suwonensis TaxID=1048394 RepID=A0A2M9C0R9_9MICO|nr:GNAT family N-acetyltransferase [Compostimonas suwonensis]PJJ63882.1 acetyltransferase (GNAT) family protein [Compostimonas suwonensis]